MEIVSLEGHKKLKEEATEKELEEYFNISMKELKAYIKEQKPQMILAYGIAEDGTTTVFPMGIIDMHMMLWTHKLLELKMLTGELIPND